MEKWEQDGIHRLEDRVAKLEQKSWERSLFWFNFAIYSMVTALLVFTAVVVTIDVLSS